MTRGIGRRINAWGPVVLYCVLLFIQSSYPSPTFLPRFFGADKLMHFGAYAFLGWLLMRAFRVSDGRVTAKKAVYYSFLLAMLYGISDEVHQFFVAARYADAMDVVADAAGGVCGALFYLLIYRRHFPS